MSEREAIDLLLEVLEEGFEVSVRLQLLPAPARGWARVRAELGDMLVPGNEDTAVYQERRRAKREEIERRYTEMKVLMSERIGNAQGVVDALREKYPRLKGLFSDVQRVASTRGRLGSGDPMADDAFLVGYYLGFFDTLKLFL